MPERQGEPLEEYSARLVGADEQRIRIHSDYVDPKGNVIVRPVIIFGQDSSGDRHPVKTYSDGTLVTWPMGTTVGVDGRATFDDTATPAGIYITPAEGDELIIMYAFMDWPAKANSGNVIMEITDGANERISMFSRIQNETGSGNLSVFGLPNSQDGADDKAGNNFPYGAMVTGTDRFRLSIFGNIVAGELFNLRSRYRSVLGLDPVVTAFGGAFA